MQFGYQKVSTVRDLGNRVRLGQQTSYDKSDPIDNSCDLLQNNEQLSKSFLQKAISRSHERCTSLG